MKRRLFNWRITVPIATLVLLGAAGFGLFYLGKVFASDILNELVSRESNGFYQLSFDKLKLNVLDKQITVEQLKLSPDTTKNFEEFGLSKLYEIELRELRIDFESIYGFYFDKKLDIKNVRLVDPHINMVKIGTTQSTKFSLEAGDIYKSISGYLKVLSIDHFRLEDGAFDYSQNDFSLGNIDFVVKNILLDSASGDSDVFFSESIELEIQNQRFNLPDGIHTLTFERLLLSTQDSVLIFKDFRLQPRPETGVTFEGNNEVNVYDIQVPELALKGIDYVAAYRDNALRLEELVLREPTVFVDDETHAEQKAEGEDNSIMALIFDVFGSLEIGKLTVQGAHVDFKLNGDKKYQRLKAEETNVEFHNIRIDSGNFRFHSRHEYFDDLVLDVHDYQYQLPDSVHVADFELFQLNTLEEKVLLKNLEIVPRLVNDSTSPTVKVFLPYVGIHGVDFRKAFLDKQLVADNLKVITSEFSMSSPGRVKARPPFEIETLHEKIKPFFEQVDIRRFVFSGKQLNPSVALHVGDASAIVGRLRISRRTKEWTDLMSSISLKLSDFSFDKDSVKVQGVGMKGTLTDFTFSNWQINVSKSKQKIFGTIDSIKIVNATIDSLIHGKFNHFTRAEIIRPELQFDIHPATKKGDFQDHIEKELVIIDARIKGTYDDWTGSIGRLNADVFVGDSTAFRSLESTDLEVKNEVLNHQLTMSKWNYDTLGGEMDFYDMKIQPLIRDSLKALIDLRVPFIGLKDFQQSRFFDENKLLLSNLLIRRPNINCFLPADTSTRESKSDTSFVVDVANVLIDSADFSLTSEEANMHELSVCNATINLEQFDFPGSMIDQFKCVYSDKLLVSADKITPHFKSNQGLDISGFSFDSYRNKVEVDQIQTLAKDESLSASLEATSILGFDLEAFQDNGAFLAEEIAIKKLTGRNKLKSEGGGAFSFTKSVDLGQFQIDEIQWEVENPAKETSYLINDAELQIEGLTSDDTLTAEQIPECVERFWFRGKEFELALNQGYTIGFDSYEISYPRPAITLKNLALKSAYTKTQFSSFIDTQSDWFDVFADQVTVYPNDLQKLIKGSYHFDWVGLTGVSALIYRDKEVPTAAAKLKPLPSAELRALAFPLQIDSLSLQGDVIYQEKMATSDVAGEMTFNDLYVGLSNIKSRAQAHEVMELRVNGALQDTGRFEVNGLFQLNHPEDRFSLSGTVSKMPLGSLNRMLEPVANVQINKGFAEQLDFSFSANDTLAQGEMRLKYRDLKIRILNAKTHEKRGLGVGIKSFFANTFVVKRKNPTFLFLRKGTIFHHRDSTKAIFNYWAKALLSGAVSSIGIHKSDKEEKKFERELDARKED